MTGTTRLLAERGDLRVTAEDVVTGELTTKFQRLYLTAFAPLRTRAAARQVLTDAEFIEEMADPRISKIVAWRDGIAVGMLTVTTELSTVPWISPEFYAARYPDAAARNAIHYFGFTLVDAAHASSGVLAALLEPLLVRIADEGGICAYDVCAFNVQTIDLPSKLVTILDRLGEHRTETVDTQSYFLTEFPRPQRSG